MRRAALLLLLATLPASAQVVTTDPVPVVETEPVDILFHARAGNGGLAGYTGDVYAHTGLITTESANYPGCAGVGWQHVKTDWGENTPETRLERLAADEYRLRIEDIRAYYPGVEPSEEILALAFVFRAGDNSREGKDTGNCDIFVPLADIAFASPVASTLNPLIVDTDTTLAVQIRTLTKATVPTITLRVNGDVFAEKDSTALTVPLVLVEPGTFDLVAVADWGTETDSASVSVTYRGPVVDAPRPSGIEDGITYDPVDETRATLSLFAPWKEYIYVIGDFNDWRVEEAYQMRRDAIRDDSVHFWIELTGLEPGREYAFQYLVDGNLRIADPYTEKVLDPDDHEITEATYPDLKPYPGSRTLHQTAVLQTGQPEFEWLATGYQRPAAKDLVIYEMHMRDFIAAHDYATLVDTLDYFVRLGVNAIELMPVNEFDGNDSWGYNPTFYFAPDKYYGPATDLKRFVDAAHARGIAVILDMVLGHSEWESPLVRLYESGGSPTAQNPWYNATCAHPGLCFYNDVDHESTATKYFVDRVNRYWVEEFRVDGYRYDFTQSFTNNASYTNYDSDRIAIIKRMAHRLWEVDPTAYVILEHWTDYSEEIQYMNDGMMVWANVTKPYQEAAMGYAPNWDLSREWSDPFRPSVYSYPRLVTYMESHDEQRLMFKNLSYGNSRGAYSTADLPVALDRMKLNAAFLLLGPGPKMLWQFEELGYDVDIDVPCRVCRKPVRWYYQLDPLRAKLYDTFSALIHLRRAHAVFTEPSTSVDDRLVGPVKYLRLNPAWNGDDVVVVGNFDVASRETTVYFPHTGTWYDFFGRSSFEVTEQSPAFTLGPGEFHVFTDFEPAVVPAEGLVTVDAETGSVLPTRVELEAAWPNPFNPSTTLAWSLPRAQDVRLEVYDAVGRLVARLVDGLMPAGRHETRFDARGLASGVYLYRLETADGVRTQTMLLLK